MSRELDPGATQESKRIVFGWDSADFDALLRSCKADDAVTLAMGYLKNKDARVLEAGCGLGRVVKYLYDRGYKNVHGIEINSEAVTFVNKRFPELRVIQGDILEMPYEAESFDFILSFGVVEHFSDGLYKPLRSLYRVLKNDGVAIITVPSLNRIRSLQAKARKFLRVTRGYSAGIPRFEVWPSSGEFFEYRLAPEQFEDECKNAGFHIVESLPICHIDGLYHLVGRPLVYFSNWEFRVSILGKMLNAALRTIPFLHNHMHACVLRK